MGSAARARALACLVGVWLPAAAHAAGITIVLDRDFVERVKNRVTIDASFVVDKAHASPNPPSKDGDLHVAGRSDEVGLATVAEIMNARDETASVDAIHAAEGTGHAVALTGVWRIWCEHAKSVTFRQGASLAAFDTTNPDHVFEIHPVTTLTGQDLVGSLKPIEGFHYKPAFESFKRYRKAALTIVPGDTTLTLKTTGVGYNYVDFKIQLNEDPSFEVPGGRIVTATVLDHDGETLVAQNKRMVFVKDSGPEVAVRALRKGDVMHILGIPRINLAVVAWRARVAAERPEVLNWPLPYEMIVVAQLDDEGE